MSQSVDPHKEQEFKKLQAEGKQLAAEGRLRESLQKFELAKKICPSEKVLKRIELIKEHINNIERESLSTCHLSTDSSSKRISTVSTNLCSSDKIALVPKVLNDIQNVQKPSAPHISTKSTDLSPISLSKFRELKKLAKESAYDGSYDKALRYFRKALSICDCPNVKRYMQEIQLAISNNPAEVPQVEDVSAGRNEQEPSSSFVHKAAQKKKSLDSCNSPKKCPDVLEKQVVRKTVSPKIPIKELEKSIQDVESDETDIKRKQEEVKVLYEEARELSINGKLTDALQVLEKAQSVYKTDKVQKRINKLKELISTDLNDSDNEQMVKVAEDFSIFHDIYNKLYPYQREGVAWMWKLYKMGKGGVLGDDMGLGKTFQVIAFISGMIDADLAKHVLIIMPVSLLQNWAKEFKKWCPGIMVYDFHSGTKKEKERNLLRVQKRGHVLLTSYGMVVNNVGSMIEMDGREFVWDYLILDEGHKIKNPTKTTKAVYEIPSKNRLVLTGTPIQNNLRELWSLYDFAQQGTLLGSLKTFKLQYENPITRSREKDATAGEKRLGTEMAENLKSLIRPYFLRRTKDEIWKKKRDADDVDQLENEMEKMSISRLNAKKNDLILWTYMSDPQIEIYNSFLHSDAVKSILVSKRSPLVELTTLKKICDHPRLLSQRACLQLGLNGDLQAEDLERELEDESTMASSIDNVSDETLLHESGKLKLVTRLLENLKENGHRTLVFSLSRKILDMIHRILVNRNWKVMRLDGTISKTEERERRIQKFQNDPSFPVFLLTTQVGGVGITLTAADRVIIYDPSWNPATDAQAVDRVYRIGQEKDVIVYRLITCGSVEEKIYRRQIFKDSITRQATGVADPYRYFSKQELRELFSLDNPHYSATQVQLCEMHSSQRLADNFLERHIHYLQTLNIFGISDHDLMFTKNIQDHSEDNDKAAISEDFIKKQVAAAHELIKMEASVVAEGIRLARTYNRPYQEAIPFQKKYLKDTYKPPLLPEVIDLTENAVDMFPSPKQKKSFEPKIPDGAFDTCSPRSIYPEVPVKYEQGEASCISPLKQDSKFSLKDTISTFKNNEFIEPGGLNTSSNMEKLRKSLDCPEQSPALQGDVISALEKSTVERVNLDIETTKNTSFNSEEESSDDEDNEVHSDVHSQALKEQNISDKSKPLSPHTVCQLMTNKSFDLKDLSFELEEPQRYVKGSRRSCARKSFMITDSDSSHRSSSESDLNPAVNLVEDSDDAASEACDSSNSANVSFVPDSSPNTPETVKLTKTHLVSETPPKVFCFESTSLPGIMSFESNNSLRKLEGNVRRITPLKVDKNQTPQNSSFVQAMEASVILTPYNSPEKNENKLTSLASPQNLADCSLENSLKNLSLDEDDSPLKFIRKKKPKQIYSDSEESDNDVVKVTDQSFSSSEENNINFENEQSYYSDCPNVKDLENDRHSDSEKSTSDDCNSEAELSNMSDSELCESDRHFEHSNKPPEENAHSDSENSNASENESYSNFEDEFSDESGSVFSDDGRD
uniref:DNA repair and recombination protein RAD54-like n=1 Tax=Cupiennius salei TaxID=6928 RepID=T1E1A5_CUPSA